MDFLIPQNSWLLVPAVLLSVVWVATVWFLWRVAKVPRGGDKIIKKLLSEVLFFHVCIPFVFWSMHKMIGVTASNTSNVVLFLLCCQTYIICNLIAGFITRTTERINKKMLPVVEGQR